MSYVKYIEKTKEYYRAEGYEQAYEWARFDEVPFAPLRKPLAQSRVILVSTSEISVRGIEHDAGDQHMGLLGGVYSIPSESSSDDLFSPSHSYDQHATSLDDVNAFFPIDALRHAQAQGRIGALADEFIGVYNAYSQRLTNERDAPEVFKRCESAGADIAVLVPV